MRDDHSPNAKSGKLFEERMAYVPPPTGIANDAVNLEVKISDIERCLKGDATSKRWQELNMELTNKKQELLYMKRHLAGRTPQMESWADPLP